MDALLSAKAEALGPRKPNPRLAAWRRRIQALPIVIFHRVRRGGLSLLLKVLAVVVLVVILIGLIPSPLNKHRNPLGWGEKPQPALLGDELRIVVFGSQDVAASAMDSRPGGATWSDVLCKELHCSTHVTYVPDSEQRPTMTLNKLYAAEVALLQSLALEANLTETPSADYRFLEEQYPIPQSADLDEQVRLFLESPAPEAPPQETLWVFTFGMWDIWNLAALPLSSGEAVVDALVKEMFDKIEHLYRESLNEQSPAHSDYWSSHVNPKAGRSAKAKARMTAEKRRRFEVIVPQLFDISLTPGWQFRKAPPLPHASTEHMRNSALLTERWNAQVRSQMKAWTMKGSAPPEGEGIAQVPQAEDGTTQYPRRTAYHAETAKKIMEVMTEEDMQRAGETDRTGRGRRPAHDKMRFMYIAGSCEARSKLVPDLGWEDKKRCRHPDNHLFFEPFTFNQRAVDEVAKMTAAGAKKNLLARGEDKEKDKDKDKDKKPK